MKCASLKEAVTGAIVALQALTMPSQSTAQGSPTQSSTPHVGDSAKTSASFSWVKDWSRQERLLAEAIEPGLREGLRAVGLGDRPLQIYLQPHGLESGTIRADGSIVLTAERLRSFIAKLVEAGIPERQAARLVGIRASETIAHEQRHVDDTKVLREAVGKEILLGSLELEVLGHRAGAVAARKLRVSGLMQDLIEAGKKCPDFGKVVQEMLAWERRASAPASVIVSHLRSMIGYTAMPSIFDRNALVTSQKKFVEGTTEIKTAQRTLAAVSNPESLSKLQDAMTKLLKEDASRFETPLRRGLSVAGAELLLATEDLKTSRELGLTFYPFIEDHHLARLLNSLNPSEQQELTTHPDVRSLLEDAYQRCERELLQDDPSFPLIAPYITFGDTLGKSFEERAALVESVICAAWDQTEKLHRETPRQLKSMMENYQRALNRDLATAAEFLGRKHQTR
jgi:polyhydroxyalkanoate synthesis regulator phasin